jgi:tetratricopeptide (TPR) repeat protein
MSRRIYRVFLSAASLDLRRFRQAAAATLEEHAGSVCLHGPLKIVYQEEFPPDYREVWEILRQRILDCDAVICLVGHAYGREPRNVPPGFPRRSYTQMEFDLAVALGKPVFLFLAEDDAELEPQATPETEELRLLQQRYRAELRSRDQVWHVFRNQEDLLAQLRRFELPPPALRRPNNLPFKSLGTLFKGRDAFLQDLHQKLGAGAGRAVGVLATQAIHGLGGVGKTRLAVEYAWRYQSDYTALLFVSADTPANLHRNLAELVGPLVLDLRDAQEAPEEEVRFAAALHWLETHPGWFLVLDNVDTEEAARAVEALLPRLQKGHVVITSRLSAWGAEVEPLDLNVLDPASSAAFLLERTAGRRRPTPADEQVAGELARVLDGLALALEQAGGYISQVRCSLADYLAQWNRQARQVLSWTDVRQMKYPRSVATTWETTWERLTPAARTLLEILAWFAPDPIPDEVLSNEAASSLLKRALAGADAVLAVSELEKYSLLKREVTAEHSLLRVHRLVQEMTRWRLEDRARHGWFERMKRWLRWKLDRERHATNYRHHRLDQTVRLVQAAADKELEDVRYWPVWNLLAPHVRGLIDLVTQTDRPGFAEPATGLMTQLARFFNAKALHTEAESLLRRALDLDEKRLGPAHPELANGLNHLAQLLRSTNRLAEAEAALRRALDLDERHSGPDHPDVARDLNQLGNLLKIANRLTEAEALLRRSLDIYEKRADPDHVAIATVTNNLAGLFYTANRLAEAEPLLRRALDMRERIEGPDHPNVATACRNVARLLESSNRHGEAEPLVRRALDIDERHYGPDHPSVASDLIHLSGLLQDYERQAECEPLLRRALDIDERHYGPEHPTIAKDLGNLARLFREIGRLQEAEPLFRRALAIDEKSFGPDHPRVAHDLNQLAVLLKDMNRGSEAEPLFHRALAIVEASYDSNHPEVARNLNDLGTLLESTNRRAEAEPLLRRALAIQEASYEPDHPYIAITLGNLARLLHDTNRLTEAEPLYRRALAIYEPSLGPNHPNFAVALSGLARLLQATHRPAEAEPLSRRALALVERRYGADHPLFAYCLTDLASLLQSSGRPAEAEPLFRRALDIDERRFGREHPRLVRALEGLAVLLQASERAGEAEPLLRRLVAVYEKAVGSTHSHVTKALTNLAKNLQAQNRLSEAELLFRRALDIEEQNLGSDHHAVAIRLNNLGALLQASNRLGEAEAYFRRAVASDEHRPGPVPPGAAIHLDNLALLLQATSRRDEAEALFRRALAITEQHFGPDHRDVARDLHLLANLLLATGRPAEAEPLLRRVVSIQEKAFGPDHPNVVAVVKQLIQSLLADNRLAEAEPLGRRLLEVLLSSSRRNRKEHPQFRAALASYRGLLEAMSFTPDRIDERLRTLAGAPGSSNPVSQMQK